jgi:flagellar secretion chaperone FliS
MSFMSQKNYGDQQRESDVAIASPMELVALTYERLLELLRLGEERMRQGSDAAEPLSKALQLITDGLQSCLNAQQGGEVASNLNLLYNWACAEILRARLRSEPQRLLAVRQVLSPVAQAWRIQAEAQATS